VTSPTPTDLLVPRDLGNGLVLRRATFDDRERLAEFHANILLEPDEIAPVDRLYFWILDLMSGKHPDFKPEDFTLVEETNTGKLASSLGLISQIWSYEGIPFGLGQIDAVSTDPAFRRRGLIREQMEAIHSLSAQRGELVQAIPGIPWYYRQFGYEMALSLGGSRICFRHQIPKLEAEASEPNVVRPATTNDMPFIVNMYRQATARSMVAAPRSEDHWIFDLEGRSALSGVRREICVIETSDPVRRPIGLLLHSHRTYDGQLAVQLVEATPGNPLLTLLPGVLRYLGMTGGDYAKREDCEFRAIVFHLGDEHPVYDSIPDRLIQGKPPYAWYIRVPDLPAFVRHITPALEQRLANSVQAGYTGELRINFYRSGLQLGFDRGAISVTAWSPVEMEDGDAAFPDLTFLQLLFGYRSLDELRHAFPDCWTSGDVARALLPILFPRKDSCVWDAE
jgi:Acetyltransferase (GNAT) domain